MDKKELSDALDDIRGVKLAEYHSLVVNYEFDSRSLFLANSVFLDSILRAIKRDGLERELEVSGPGSIDFPGANDAWAIVVKGEGYTEAAVAYCQRFGNDGWAAFQHSTTLPEAAYDAGSMFLRSGRLVSAVSSIIFSRQQRLDSTEKEHILHHFMQAAPQAVCREGIESPISGYIIDAFYSKGWNLYELSPGKSSRQLLEQGAASSIKIGVFYQLMPVTFDSKNVEAVVHELRKMRDTFQEPAVFSEGKRIPVSYICIRPDCFSVRFSGNSEGITKQFQLAERMILDNFSSYDRTAFSQKKPEGGNS